MERGELPERGCGLCRVWGCRQQGFEPATRPLQVGDSANLSYDGGFCASSGDGYALLASTAITAASISYALRQLFGLISRDPRAGYARL